MGIVYSALAPTAVRIAYICQKLFDPKYSRIEDVPTSSGASAELLPAAESAAAQQQQQLQSTLATKLELSAQEPSLTPGTVECRILAVKSNSLPRYSARSSECSIHSLHQQNRSRRARQIRFKTRPSSFDGALVIRTKTKNAVIVTSTPSPLAAHWHGTSSSGCSSDSNSDSESDSETELRVSATASNEEIGRQPSKLAMTAEQEQDFRLTLGRGHFTRSKKDRFLNNLRLQKQSIHHHTAPTPW
ncbi:uncharacterized protein LOC131673608 [Phymastichus coffea]|uniref:uncharacterized protein LOC131673608 n=1 Tax=Phymastichus coffea TaxID=108790 RepID=UPI00273C9C6F|nr:uncharacterized protein LOC131673608 [Phymastichus coffea]